MFRALKEQFAKASKKRSENPEVISYQAIRKAVGYLALSLPFALAIGSFLFGHCRHIQPSISHYYYTNMREIFEGTLYAVALFLFSYKGYSRLDSIATNLAGLFCLGVALFPTDKVCYPCQHDLVSLFNIHFHATIHFTSAALFFVTLALISIFLFTKSDLPEEMRTPRKRTRNVIYKVCGGVIIYSIGSIAYYFFICDGDSTNQIVFWFETLALISFGISWLTKGEALFGDTPSTEQKA